MMRTYLTYFLTIFMLCNLTTVLHATVITFEYAAFDVIGGGTVEGTFGYDPRLPDLDPRDFQGIYQGGFWNGVITGGDQDGATFSFPNTEVIIQNDLLGSDAMLFVAQRGRFLNFQLLDASGVALNSDQLPSFRVGTELLTVFSDENFLALDNAAIGIPTANTSTYNFTSAKVVPEPSTLVLIIIGVLSFIGIMNRQLETLE